MKRSFVDTGVDSISRLRRGLLKYEQIIFDLDNTIFPEEVFDRAAFAQIALEFNSTSESEISQFVNQAIIFKSLSRENLFNRLFPNFNHVQILEVVDYYQGFRFGPCLADYSIKRVIEEMYLLGKDMYLVTNGHPVRQKNKIIDLSIGDFFKSIYICHPLTQYNLKPDPNVLNCIEKDGCLSNCVMVGDDALIDGEFARSKEMDYYQFFCSSQMQSKENVWK